jgi:Ca-activated chloride channel family protein
MLRRVRIPLVLALPLACARTPLDVPAPALEPAVVVDERGREALAWVPVGAFDDPVRDVVYTDPGELPQLLAGARALPLRRTDVRADLRGNVAEVRVTQRFVNDGAGPLEAVYTFPLPENSAVTDLRMTIGARTITGEVRERGAARREYDAAAAAGHTAALLEQERPNVFTQSVANIPPGEAVDVELRYLQTLSYDAGEYEFVFPTVVGPRYLPGAPLGASGRGVRPDTDRVPDASRISPPVLGRGERSGHDLAIEVHADAAAPITAWAAPAHHVEALAAGPGLHLRLVPRSAIPNRDFVLRYRSADARPVAKLYLGPAGDGGHFLLVADPPRVDVDALVGARELIFVVDVSGSMSGPPLELAKATMRAALDQTRPVDTFDVITFAGAAARLFGTPHPANAANLARAFELLDGLSAGGGTEMAAAVDAALTEPVGEGRHRYVLFLTDGYIGEEAQIAAGARALVRRQQAAGRRARVFGVGIGAAPNDHLIAALSRAGDGLPLSVHLPADVPRSVHRFQRTIDAPILTDVEVDWSGLQVDGLSPAGAQDLLASHPLVLHGRYRGAPPTAVALRGRVGGRSVTIPVAVVPVAERPETLARLWARDRVGELELALAADAAADTVELVRDEILQLGLRHHLVTSRTSLVAVDRSRRISGAPHTVVQPVLVPDGVDPDLAGAGLHLDESRGVPLGGAARDFTAVVEVAPDAAGVRLGGTTRATSRHVVDGASTSAPAFSVEVAPGQSRRARVRETFLRVEPHARVRVHRLTAAAHAPDLQRGVLARADALGRCFVDADRATYRVRRQLVLAVVRDRDGRLARLELLGGAAPAPILECLRGELDAVLAATPKAAGRVEIDLRVWMQY